MYKTISIIRTIRKMKDHEHSPLMNLVLLFPSVSLSSSPSQTIKVPLKCQTSGYAACVKEGLQQTHKNVNDCGIVNQGRARPQTSLSWPLNLQQAADKLTTFNRLTPYKNTKKPTLQRTHLHLNKPQLGRSSPISTIAIRNTLTNFSSSSPLPKSKNLKKNKKMALSLRESIVSGCNNNNNNIFAEGIEEEHGGRRGRKSSRVRSRRDGKESPREGGREDGGGVSGREKLKRHRMEVAGKVWIPEAWGQEELLKDWVDSSSFNLSLVPLGVVSARQALVQDQCRRSSSITTLQIDNRC